MKNKMNNLGEMSSVELANMIWTLPEDAEELNKWVRLELESRFTPLELEQFLSDNMPLGLQW